MTDILADPLIRGCIPLSEVGDRKSVLLVIVYAASEKNPSPNLKRTYVKMLMFKKESLYGSISFRIQEWIAINHNILPNITLQIDNILQVIISNESA
jgi:hypothetical protein